MEPSFEIFDHTADAGIRIRASTLPGLLMPAAQGLYAVVGELVPTSEVQPVRFEMEESDEPIMFRDYLGELLILLEREKRMITAIEDAAFDEHHLAATAKAAVVDDQRSAYHREVKAVTYHELDIKVTPEGYEATVIVDI